MSTGPGVAGAEITGWVVVESWSWIGLGYFALPGTLRAMWRHEHPVPAEGIVATMRECGRVR